MFLAVFARSSTPLKRGLMVANGVGVVDSDYCGPADEIKVPVINVTTGPVRLSAGDRIAQGILLPAPRVSWEEVGELRAALARRIWVDGAGSGSGLRAPGFRRRLELSRQLERRLRVAKPQPEAGALKPGA